MSKETETPTKIIKWYVQSFKEEWLQDPDLKEWLQQVKTNKDDSHCLCCNVTLKSTNKSILINKNNQLNTRNVLK
jgi:hypothetical protein